MKYKVKVWLVVELDPGDESIDASALVEYELNEAVGNGHLDQVVEVDVDWDSTEEVED